MTRARDLANSTPGTTGQPFRMAAGSGTVDGTGLVAITYPASRFTQNPVISAVINAAPTNGITLMFYGNSTTGATFYLSAAFLSFNYVAVQMTSSASAG